LEVEEKIKAGAENLLKVITGQYTIDRKVYGVKHKSAKPEQKLSRKQAEEALNLSNSKIANLKTLLKQSPKSLSSDCMADFRYSSKTNCISHIVGSTKSKY